MQHLRPYKLQATFGTGSVKRALIGPRSDRPPQVVATARASGSVGQGLIGGVDCACGHVPLGHLLRQQDTTVGIGADISQMPLGCRPPCGKLFPFSRMVGAWLPGTADDLPLGVNVRSRLWRTCVMSYLREFVETSIAAIGVAIVAIGTIAGPHGGRVRSTTNTAHLLGN